MALVIANWDSDFGAVHDSFSTYATDIESLMEKTRVSFIDMYDKENFYEEISFGKGFNGNQPTIGNLSIKEVVNSNYFFC